jgi:hypothetical protein
MIRNGNEAVSYTVFVSVSKADMPSVTSQGPCVMYSGVEELRGE